jgi:hypothetical protein
LIVQTKPWNFLHLLLLCLVLQNYFFRWKV